MRRIRIPLVLSTFLIVASLLGAAAPAAVNAAGNQQLGPIPGASQDGSTCGPVWANDTYNLFFTIHDNGDGTYAMRTEYKDGSFNTIAGSSPGACETTNHHGTLVSAGIPGNFQGFIDGTVTGGTYNPNANLSGCTATTPCTRTQVIALVFGTAAFYNQASYNFEYNSSDKSLQYRSWHENFNVNSTSEQDIGDIANQ